MKKFEKEHYVVMGEIDKELGFQVHDDTWGRYSKNLIARDISLSEALRNALIQFYAAEDSLYKLER